MSLKRRLKEAYQQALRKMFELGQLFLTFCRDTFARRSPISARCEKTTGWYGRHGRVGRALKLIGSLRLTYCP